MFILSAQQIKNWDEYTIHHEPISSIDLMERAAKECCQWMEFRNLKNKPFKIFCGKGNNGGDGLAIARLLNEKECKVSVYILQSNKKGSEDFEMNLQRLQEISFDEIYFIDHAVQLPFISKNDIIIDALFGSGLNKPLQGFDATVVKHINQSTATVVSIDLPSGLFIDQSSKNNVVIEANYTLTFQCYKLGLLVQENASYFGEVSVLNIGLHPDFFSTQNFNQILVERNYIQSLLKKRSAFANKGNFGHALLIGGSYGKMGAAVLSAKACLHSGVGLLTCYIPKCGYHIMQTVVPEAMVMTDKNEDLLSNLPDDIEKFSVIGIGPGIGTADETQNLISFVVRRYQKILVIDADGLNCLSLQKELIQQLPFHSIFTPHPKEFDRLFGDHQNDFERINTARQKAIDFNIVIVLKSHHTLIAMPSGKLFFNSTGNAGMAKGGSGDVLTGIITSLIAQNYSSENAAILAVYLHGLSGDLAAKALSEEAMVAGDLISFLPEAFLSLK